MSDSVAQRLHAPFKFSERLRVRFGETDAQRIVSNSAYLDYFEVARIEYFRSLGVLDAFDQTLAEACVQYRSPARFDDLLDIGCRATRLGRSSFRLEYMVREVSQDTLIATGHTIQVAVESQTLKPMKLTETFRSKLRVFEGPDLSE